MIGLVGMLTGSSISNWLIQIDVDDMLIRVVGLVQVTVLEVVASKESGVLT